MKKKKESKGEEKDKKVEEVVSELKKMIDNVFKKEKPLSPKESHEKMIQSIEKVLKSKRKFVLAIGLNDDSECIENAMFIDNFSPGEVIGILEKEKYKFLRR